MAFPVQIEKLVYGGRGLARAEGRVVLAPFVLPGERVLVETERESRDLISARILKIESPDPARIDPPCPVFSRCGGCHYQHIPYERQLEAKRAILLETLARLGRVEWTGPVEVIPSEPYGYRNRTQLHLGKRGAHVELGYFEHGSHRLCSIKGCPISSPAIQQAIPALRSLGANRSFPEFLHTIELFTNETNLLLTVLESDRPLSRRFYEWCRTEIPELSTEPHLDYGVGPDVFRVSSRSFFQINRFLVPRLAGDVLGDAAGRAALDLYAGAGLFTLPLARRFERVTALDAGRSAVADLAFNAKRAGVPITLHHGPAERFLAGFSEPVDFILADPPRAGLGPAVTEALVRLRPARLTLVSCDPATLARDLRALLAGGFQLGAVKMVDLFPQTYHIESIIELQSG